jgi:hypothetical protein
MLRLNIQEPCHEKWDQMTPVVKGAFCGACKRTVTDFSGMRDKEILDHLAAHQFEPSCGRFRKSQLNRPLIYISPDVLTMDIPLWKKFLAAVFICFSGFLIGCSNNTKFDVTEAIPPPTAIQPQIVPVTFTTTKDTVCEETPTTEPSERKNIRSLESMIERTIVGFFSTDIIDTNPAPFIFTTKPNGSPTRQ